MPRLLLKYKSYSAPGINLKKGDIHGVSEAEADRLLALFPDWWEKLGEQPQKASAVGGDEEKPTRHPPEGSHGKSKRSKR